MKRGLCAGLLIILMIIPGLGLTEGEDTIQLARTIYTLGRDESYETKLMIGSVVMNRVDSPWYPDTIMEVLNQPHQFPRGSLFDDDSLKAAREIMMGRRSLADNITEYTVINNQESGERMTELDSISGRYGFSCPK